MCYTVTPGFTGGVEAGIAEVWCEGIVGVLGRSDLLLKRDSMWGSGEIYFREIYVYRIDFKELSVQGGYIYDQGAAAPTHSPSQGVGVSLPSRHELFIC